MSPWQHLIAVARHRPTALLGLPWRKVRARLRRHRHGNAPAAPLARLAPGGLNALLGAARETPFWCSPSRRADLLEALDPAMRARAMRRAEEVLGGRVEALGALIPCDARGLPDWRVDPVSGHRWKRAPAARLALRVAGGDVKVPWAVGRLDEALWLSMAAAIARDEAFAKRCAFLARAWVEDFLAENPPGLGVQWTCAMEVALRAVNLAQVLHLLADRPECSDPSWAGRMGVALHAHLAHVAAHLEDDQAVPNNHLVAGLVGLSVVPALVPGVRRASAPLPSEEAVRHQLLRELRLQVHPDGVSFEGSVPYHRLALELFTLAFLCDVARGVAWPEPARERLARMFRASDRLCSERGLAPQLGDNDSGRALPLTRRAPLDFSYLSPLGSALFSLPRAGPPPDGARDELAWLCGTAGLRALEVAPRAERRHSGSFHDGGLHVLSGAGAHLVVSAGPMGQSGVGGHSHLDKLSFELHVEGQPVIVDSGTATYTRSPGMRNRMRGTSAHNTLLVDGEEQVPLHRERLFALSSDARAHAEFLMVGETVERLSVRHDGYRRLSSPVRVRRHFLLDKHARALAVEELLEGRGLHGVCWRLHLAGEGARLQPAPVPLLARAAQVPGAPARFDAMGLRLASAGTWLLFEDGLRPTLGGALHSPGYGVTARGARLTFGAQVALPRRWHWMALWDGRSGDVRSRRRGVGTEGDGGACAR